MHVILHPLSTIDAMLTEAAVARKERLLFHLFAIMGEDASSAQPQSSYDLEMGYPLLLPNTSHASVMRAMADIGDVELYYHACKAAWDNHCRCSRKPSHHEHLKKRMHIQAFSTWKARNDAVCAIVANDICNFNSGVIVMSNFTICSHAL